jgi:hypothetical protein
VFLQFWNFWIIKLVFVWHAHRLFMHHFLKLGIVYGFYCNELIMFTWSHLSLTVPSVISTFNSNVLQTHFICMITYHAHCILIILFLKLIMLWFIIASMMIVSIYIHNNYTMVI